MNYDSHYRIKALGQRDRSCLPIMAVVDVEDMGYVAQIAAALSS